MATTFPTIRQLASLIDSVISLFPPVPLGKLPYRVLKTASGNFDKIVANISVKAVEELNWWITEIPHVRRIIHLDIDFTIHTDASETGWRATDGNNSTGGKWIEEKGNHTNYPELKAIYLVVKSYRRYWLYKKHIQVNSDNITAIAYINNMGGSVSEKWNELDQYFWHFCIQENIWISAVHIPGKENTLADYMS